LGSRWWPGKARDAISRADIAKTSPGGAEAIGVVHRHEATREAPNDTTPADANEVVRRAHTVHAETKLEPVRSHRFPVENRYVQCQKKYTEQRSFLVTGSGLRSAVGERASSGWFFGGWFRGSGTTSHLPHLTGSRT
jgi:hypothetical protein